MASTITSSISIECVGRARKWEHLPCPKDLQVAIEPERWCHRDYRAVHKFARPRRIYHNCSRQLKRAPKPLIGKLHMRFFTFQRDFRHLHRVKSSADKAVPVVSYPTCWSSQKASIFRRISQWPLSEILPTRFDWEGLDRFLIFQAHRR